MVIYTYKVHGVYVSTNRPLLLICACPLLLTVTQNDENDAASPKTPSREHDGTQTRARRLRSPMNTDMLPTLYPGMYIRNEVRVAPVSKQ